MVYFEGYTEIGDEDFEEVSILVLMDGVLREKRGNTFLRNIPRFNPCSNGWCTSSVITLPSYCALLVSILVLMDGVLRVAISITIAKTIIVSILVLMDGVLRASENTASNSSSGCFNPCSNGWCTSRAETAEKSEQTYRSFNPCSNGWCTSSKIRRNGK